MALPDIARGPAGAVKEPPCWSGFQAATGPASRRMLRFGQRVGDVDAAGVAAAGVREHADYVRPGHCGVFGSLLEHENEPGAAPASTTLPVSANQRSAGARSSGRRGE